MIRSPEIRYTGADAPTTPCWRRSRPASTTTSAAARCRSAAATRPRPRRAISWAGAPGPFPPASGSVDPPHTYTGAVLRARRGLDEPGQLEQHRPSSTHNGNASNHQHWTQVYCGHEIQINESLTGGGPNPSTDPIKTGSIYGFRNLNAQQSRTYERLEKGVWHEMEIRMVGQQYTVLVDGRIINQFDNSVPKVASRTGDPRPSRASSPGLPRPADARRQRPHQLPRDPGQGARAGRHPGQHGRADGDGHRLRRPEPDLQHRHLDPGHGRLLLAPVVPVEQDRARTHPRFRAPSQIDLGNFSTPADPAGTTATRT